MAGINQNRRLICIIAIACALLLLPLITMIFTDAVNWDLPDFIVAAILLITAGLALEFILRKIKRSRDRILLGIVLFLILGLIWIELAVGFFGTPLAGN